MRQAIIYAVLLISIQACGFNHRQNAPVPVRFTLGAATQPVFRGMAFDVEKLRESEVMRRKLAWQVLGSLLENTRALRDKDFTVPRFLTLYDRQDLKQIVPFYMKHRLDNPQTRAFASADAAFEHNENALSTLPIWTDERYHSWRKKLDTPEKTAGAFGLVRASYGPSIVRDLLIDHAKVERCGDIVAHHDAEDRLNSDNFSLCITQELSGSAIAIKASWQRLDSKGGLGVYDTDQSGFGRRIAEGSWDIPDRYIEPDEKDFFRIELADGSIFLLTGLHVSLKVLREWFWISMWWSDAADKDFGSDRPREGVWLEDRWSNYKLCTVVDYADTIPSDHPNQDLQVNQKRFWQEYPGRSWCSNPYLEKGKHNATTNCIGCHQHAGAAITQGDILKSQSAAGYFRLDKVRTNFPTDYVYGVNFGPDNFSTLFRATQ